MAGRNGIDKFVVDLLRETRAGMTARELLPQWEKAGKPPVAATTMRKALQRGVKAGALYRRKKRTSRGESAEYVFYAHLLDSLSDYDVRPGNRIFHRKGGGTYTILFRAVMHHAGELDRKTVVAYTCKKGEHHVRLLSEMVDGRFELIEDE